MTNTPATESVTPQATPAPQVTPTAPASKKATTPNASSQRAAPKKAAPRQAASSKTAADKAPAKAQQAKPVGKSEPKIASKAAPKAKPNAATKADSTAVTKATPKTAPKTASNAAAPVGKVKTAAPKPAVNKPAVSPAKPAKDKKVKVVRDSFTIPKNELLQIGESKKRALGLGVEIKKSELIRAGLQALTSLNDAAFKKALASVPTIKTGRPAKS